MTVNRRSFLGGLVASFVGGKALSDPKHRDAYPEPPDRNTEDEAFWRRSASLVPQEEWICSGFLGAEVDHLADARRIGRKMAADLKAAGILGPAQ